MTTLSTDPGGRYVLVRGVVYKHVSRSFGGTSDRVYWLRLSVPPDATPGRRSKWPPTYTEHELPAHEQVDAVRAKEIQVASLARLDVFRTGADGG